MTQSEIHLPDGRTVQIQGEITADDLRAQAWWAGLDYFVVLNEQGEYMYPEDFPYMGKVRILEYEAR